MKADLHVHSNASGDGILEPRDILNRLRALGFSAVAILDHNTVQGSLMAAREAEERGMIVIRGSEISSADGHIGALGISEDIPKGLSAEDTVQRIHEFGGLAIAVHPFRFNTGLGSTTIRSCHFDAVEVLNGSTGKRRNARALELAGALVLPQVAGSDAHIESDLGSAYVVFEDCETEEELLEMISRGQTSVMGSSRTESEAIRNAANLMINWVRRGFRRV